VDWSEIATRCAVQWYDGITTDELSESTIMAATSLIEVHPNYDFVAARLLLRRIYKEVVTVGVLPVYQIRLYSEWAVTPRLMDENFTV
jgi:ribonucleoside-diphosphate reductase alpha chain